MARVLDLEAEQLRACVSSKAEVKHQTLIILAASTLIQMLYILQIKSDLHGHFSSGPEARPIINAHPKCPIIIIFLVSVVLAIHPV